MIRRERPRPEVRAFEYLTDRGFQPPEAGRPLALSDNR